MKLRAVLVLAVFGAITAQADPLSAYEGFEYTAGANLGTENGGTEVESPLASCIVIPPSGSRATRRERSRRSLCSTSVRIADGPRTSPVDG
jgi:hypothetical protein